MNNIDKRVEELMNFRSMMNMYLSKDDIKRIWGKSYFRSLAGEKRKVLKDNQNEQVIRKKVLCTKYIKYFKIFNWVKFIGISGSVAAGFAKEEDDIDIFIVVRNDTLWIYRGLVVFLALFHNRIRSKRHRDVKDKLCLNLICEERDLLFDDDIFNFHELMFLIPIFNESYLNYIYSKNSWLVGSYGVKKESLKTKITPSSKVSLPIELLNKISFYAQLIFMFLIGHNPDLRNLFKNMKRGRIEFFEKDYRDIRVKNYLKRFKSIN